MLIRLKKEDGNHLKEDGWVKKSIWNFIQWKDRVMANFNIVFCFQVLIQKILKNLIKK